MRHRHHAASVEMARVTARLMPIADWYHPWSRPGLPARALPAPMFDNLSDKLQSTLGELRQRGSLTEQDLDAAMREIRLALLEADVNFKVVRTFVAAVRERTVGGDVLKSLTPGQQVVKIVDEELTELLGGESVALTFAPKPPTVILLCGLQGSGKTTFAGKLARRLRSQGKSPALVACDVYRPAAIDQLRTLGEQVGVPVFERGTDADPVEIARWGVESATQQGRDVILVDTAGRLHVDRELMDELARISKKVSPQHTLLVLDSMTGQEAVSVAEQFQEAVDFDGVVLTKLDGDARGGAALSVRAVTGRPILFVGVGEKLDALEEFHPERMASRILGMGDMLSLIERAEGQLDKEQSEELERKIRKNEFTLDDLHDQIQQIRKLGSMRSILGMLPGIGKQVREAQIDEGQLDRVQAIILSMTPKERREPAVIDGSRRKRIAAGSGTSVQQVNQVLQQYRQMRKLMKQFATGGVPAMPNGMAAPGARPSKSSRKKHKRR
jgi:signal recognition particle subunit SRP54